MHTKELRKQIEKTSTSTKKWFEENANSFTKKEFDSRGSLSKKDKKIGAVYVYLKNNKALYVGETGGGVKERTHFQTSKHTDSVWWNQWDNMKFLQITDRTDRLLLELLLILAYAPMYNQKPGARRFSSVFS